jgi:multiple sugar transport system ATP-binding protein
MATVTFDHVTKRYGADVTAVNDLNLSIADGEFLVLVGPSGCGKTTALRCVAGLETITDGRVLIGDRVVNDVAPKDRDIAMVFQSYALYPHMSVFDNLAFGLKLRKMSKTEIDTRVKQAAEILGLERFLDRKPKALSGGQRQRVALGRAIVREPKVFLMDEPLSNLDAKLRVQTRAEILRLHRRLGTTIIYVTHDQVEAMTMADRIVVMHDGIVEQIGTPLDLYDNPCNLFVAGFIGSPAMNFIEGTLKHESNQTWVDTHDGSRLPAPPANARSGDRVVYGVRPEHLGLANGVAGVEALVHVVEPTGADTLVYSRLAGIDVCSVFAERHTFRPGERIALKPRLDSVHLFDATSGKNLRS